MKKAFGIFAIFYLATLSPAMADRKITVKWELTSPNQMNSIRYFVYDLDNECTNTSENDLHLGSFAPEYGIYGEETFICPDSKQSLTVYFDFGIRKGQKPIGMGSPTTLTNFSETLNISKQKKHNVTKKLESYYWQQTNKVTQVAKQYCTQGLFSLSHTNYNYYTFCCTDGYAVSNESALRATLKEIIGPYSLTINETCPKQESQTSSGRDAANEEYAKQLGDSDNWQEMEAQQPIQPVAKSSSTAAQNITVSGTVVGADGNPIPGVTIAPETSTGIGTTTDIDGKFTLNKFPSGEKLVASFVGYKSVTTDPSTNLKITLVEDAQNIEDVVVEVCRVDYDNGIKKQKSINGKCYPTECITPRWELVGAEKSAKCVEQKCTIEHGNGKWQNIEGKWTCIVNSCNSNYKPGTNNTECIEKLKECTATQKSEHPNALSTGIQKDTETCVATECKCGYTLTDGKCIAWPSTGMACTNDTKPKMPSNASAATMACNTNDRAYCRVTACNDNYAVNSDETECTSERGDLCQSGDANAKRAEYKKDKKTKKLICVIKECVDGYDVNKDGTQCVPECECGQEYNESTNKCVPWTDTACNDTQKPKLPSHATSGEKKCNGKRAYCEVTACDDGFKVSDDKKSCTNVRGDECDATAIDKNATAGKYKKSNGEMTCVIQECARGFEPNKSGTKCVAKNVLSEEESQKKIDELRDNAENMKAKEQSTENKLLGAAGMGATGIGGMMLASGMAEQNADAEAETAMRAYLATFHCNYGGGKNVPHGTENVELPGGNELIALYTEYVNLANDLKARKADLGMAPGIESEAILESATSGLYDDVAVGKTSGAYVSLARALMDPEGEDAKLWAEQKDKTAQQIKTGAITAGVGAAGSLIGNLAINSGKDKQNKVDEILNKYNKLKKPFDNLEEKVKQVTPETKPCPSDATGSAHPNCTCRDTSKVYNPNNATCEACTGGRINVENQCKCPENLPVWDESGGKCVENPQACTPQCTPTEGSHLVLDKTTCQCSCSDGFDLVNDTCQCNNPKSVNESGKCVQVEVKTIEKVLNQTTITNDTTLPASNLFKIGSYELLAGAKTALDSFVSELGAEGISDCEITIVGYTDPVGAVATNQRLSEQRANSVRQYLENKRSGSIKAITSSGHGENNCTCGIRTENMDYSNRDYSVCKDKEDTHPVSGDARYAPCRRVEISAKCKQTSTTGGFVDGLVDGLTGK